MIPLEKASCIISKNLLKDVNKLKFITPVCMHRKRFSTKYSTISLYESVKSSFSNIYKRYEEFSGVTEMKNAQKKVVEAGEKLEILQEDRRKAWANLAEVQRKLKENYNQLENTRKGDERYIDLIKSEVILLNEEVALEEKYKSVDGAERAQFINFTNAVKNSHEVERIQSEKKKYFSLIASIVGALFGIIGSSISHYFKMSEIKLVLSKLSGDTVTEQLETQLTKIENLAQAFSEFEKNYDAVNLNHLCDKLDERLVSMENYVKTFENKNYIEVLGNDESKPFILDLDHFSIFSKDPTKSFMNAWPTGIICIVGLIILGKILQ